jgi:hypothetical protein
MKTGTLLAAHQWSGKLLSGCAARLSQSDFAPAGQPHHGGRLGANGFEPLPFVNG